MDVVLKVHVEVDTGLSRLGLLPDQVMPFFRGLRNLHNVQIEGMFTHFAAAEDDITFTYAQLAAFQDILKPLTASGYQFKHIHAANTAAALSLPDTRLNMVRVGLGMYGLSPADGFVMPEGFRPALTWKTTVAQVKTLAPGAYVGYGRTYRARGPERIAVLPVGYADGFRRAPKHWGHVLVGGQRAPIVGRVSMDMTMINVTDIPGVSAGDEAVLIGRQGDSQITVDDVAAALETSSYEVISTILPRVARV
jgi:alanine racemase